jgi:hypothetical protein
MGVDVADAEAAALEEPVDAIERAIVQLPLEPFDGRVELLGRRVVGYRLAGCV